MMENVKNAHVFEIKGCSWCRNLFCFMCWKNLRLCSKPFFGKTNFWANIAYPMLYLVELAFFWYQNRVIRSSVAQDMNDTVGDVKLPDSRISLDSKISIERYTWFLDIKFCRH